MKLHTCHNSVLVSMQELSLLQHSLDLHPRAHLLSTLPLWWWLRWVPVIAFMTWRNCHLLEKLFLPKSCRCLAKMWLDVSLMPVPWHNSVWRRWQHDKSASVCVTTDPLCGCNQHPQVIASNKNTPLCISKLASKAGFNAKQMLEPQQLWSCSWVQGGWGQPGHPCSTRALLEMANSDIYQQFHKALSVARWGIMEIKVVNSEFRSIVCRTASN